MVLHSLHPEICEILTLFIGAGPNIGFHEPPQSCSAVRATRRADELLSIEVTEGEKYSGASIFVIVHIHSTLPSV